MLPAQRAVSQVAGMNNLSVLDMTASARSAGLGFDYLPLADGDLVLAVDNPSMLSPEMHNNLSFNYVALFN